MTPEIRGPGSTGDSIHAAEGANVNLMRLMVPKTKQDWLAAVLLLSVAVNVSCGLALRDQATEQRLKQYNLDWFKTHEFSDLKAQVDVNQKLITAFGPQTCKR